MSEVLATMLTTTTYGTWLPGDARGYVERGHLLPPSPNLEHHARRLLTKAPVFLDASERHAVFVALQSAASLYRYELLAVAVESWHVHWLVVQCDDDVPAIVGRLKTAMRKALQRGRVWSAGYDVRFCYSESDVAVRHDYIARHPGFRPLD